MQTAVDGRRRELSTWKHKHRGTTTVGASNWKQKKQYRKTQGEILSDHNSVCLKGCCRLHESNTKKQRLSSINQNKAVKKNTPASTPQGM